MADQYQQQNYSQSSNNLGPDGININTASNDGPTNAHQSFYGRPNEKAMSEMKRIDANNMKSMGDKESQYASSSSNNIGVPR